MPPNVIRLTRAQTFALLLGSALSIMHLYAKVTDLHRLSPDSPVLYTHQALMQRTALLWSRS